MVTWSLVLGLVYTLHSLFAVIFITFVVSYICRNFVKLAYSPFGEKPYVRKIIVILTFVFLLFGIYLAFSFLIPNIYQQGEKMVATVKELKVHQDFGTALPNLVAKIEYSWSYEDSEEYKREFEEYKKNEKNPGEKLYKNFLVSAKDIREEFEKKICEEKGEEEFHEIKNSEAYTTGYTQWLLLKLEEDYSNNKDKLETEKMKALKKKYKDKFDTIYGQRMKDQARWTQFLKERIIEDKLDDIAFKSEMESKHRDRYRKKVLKELGERALADLRDSEEWNSYYKDYYETWKENHNLTFEFEKFLELENAKSLDDFILIRGVGGNGASNDTTFRAAFELERIEKLSKKWKESPIVKWLNEQVKTSVLPEVTDWVTNAVAYIASLLLQLITAVFLSFFIVWDIPKLKVIIQRLKDSRIGNFYKEVAPGLVSFGWLMGRAFQAQAIIAVVNTAMTLSAMTLLDIPHRTFLSSIVFLCSFIPVVGVVISSIPMVVVAIQLPSGVFISLQIIGCVLLIHFIESTLLNPKIMGDMLKLHPLLVLVILLVGEHFFGVWGLLLGVPVSVYIFRFVILKEKRGPTSNGLDAKAEAADSS